MRYFFLASLTLVAGISYVGVFHAADAAPASREQAASTFTPSTANANRLLQGQPGFFVPNLGQWDHAASFVHRSGPMTLFLQDRGWLLNVVEPPKKKKGDPRDRFDPMRAMPQEDTKNEKIRGVLIDAPPAACGIGVNTRKSVVDCGAD